MSYVDTIRMIGADAEKLELAFQDAIGAGETDAFGDAINVSFAEQPDNLLYAAWYYRLAHAVSAKAKAWSIAWGWALPLALINGLLFWWLSDGDQFMIEMADYATNRAYDFMPTLALIWAPICAGFIMLYVMLAGKTRWPWMAAIAAGLGLVSIYVLQVYVQTGPRVFQQQYLTLMAFHLPLMAWAGVGLYLLSRQRNAQNSFAFLIKSLEVFIMAGLFIIAGGIFTGITVGLFDALGIQLDEWVQRLFFAGGGGLIPVLAVAVIYNPAATPEKQPFSDGLSPLIALLMRVLLPLSLLVLAIYLAFIPFNFRQPFENREVLIIYNAMLFAIMALLVGATPVHKTYVSERLGLWLRRGIIAVAILATLIGLYALSALVYRTWQDKLTPNRLAFIGWNVVNIGILLLLLFKQWFRQHGQWVTRLHSTFAAGSVIYVLWALVMILTIPWLFGIDQGQVDLLPASVQKIVYDEAYPILLKCTASPHVYSLEKGQKRWIKDIPTFESEGFNWSQVRRVPCDDLRIIPDGVPIPADAGPAPQP